MKQAFPSDLAELPDAYRAWRNSELGRLTDRIEEDLIVGLVGSVRGTKVLDVGCGDAVLSIRLAAAGAEVTGVDTDPRTLAVARKRADNAGEAVAFVKGNILSLPFPDSSFDRVVTVAVLCFIEDIERAVQEMARVLRPGGRLVLGELGRYSLWATKRRVAGWFGSKIWPKAIFRTAGELRQCATASGLEVAQVRGAIYYPPCALCARWTAQFDSRCSAVTTIGAAFIALTADKPK
ncbi:MAG: class I SAM-dependent methyltransferase [Alphaproteobacteria bacterium]|nr:class I SAM-dependent methyltransferase [Alphaproteobacteria bacterium]